MKRCLFSQLIRVVLLGIPLCLVTLSVHAQPIHATTDDGRSVRLNKNGTWKFDTPNGKHTKSTKLAEYQDDEGLVSVSLPAESGWEHADKPLGGSELSFMHSDPVIYAALTAEKLPLTADEVFRYVWLATEDTTQETFREKRNYVVDGKPATLYVFDKQHEGLDFVMNLVVCTGDDWYAKAIVWTFKSVAEKSPNFVDDFVQHLKLLKE